MDARSAAFVTVPSPSANAGTTAPARSHCMVLLIIAPRGLDGSRAAGSAALARAHRTAGRRPHGFIMAKNGRRPPFPWHASRDQARRLRSEERRVGNEVRSGGAPLSQVDYL